MISNPSYQGSYKLIISIWNKLKKRRKIQLGFILLVMLLSGLAEIINLSAIVPFLIILTDPNKISDNTFFSKFLSFLEIDNQTDLFVPIILLFSFTALLTGLIRVFNLWLNTKLAAAIGNDLSYETYRKTLLQPYKFHLQKNSSTIINSIVNNIRSTIIVVDRCLAISTSIIIIINILIALLIFNRSVSIIVGLILFVVYFSISYYSKLKLGTNSRIQIKKQKEQIKIIQESLGAIKETIIFNSSNVYLENYKKTDKSIRNLYANNIFLASFPRYTIESFALFILSLSTLFLMSEEGFVKGSLVTLGVFALAAQRLLPNLQLIYNCLSAIRSNSEQAANIVQILNMKMPDNLVHKNFRSFKFNKSIKFENVSFKYSESGEEIIKNINFELFKGENIGIIGKTGSGKSTLIDLFLGLLKPSRGRLLIDGRDINDPSKPEVLLGWQNLLTYVPQNIYLMDTSIKQNIAFGIPKNDIDKERVINCAKQARIHEFIKSMNIGYDTFVGERGVRLSGGQIQRIGIARALYKQSKIIIFDEATSALDYATEVEVIKSIRTINKSCTIIMIAHRMNNIRNCDKVIEIESGRINRVIYGDDIKNL